MRLLALLSSVWTLVQHVPADSMRDVAPPALAPHTTFGREVEALLGALRLALVLVPVAIVAAELRRIRRERRAAAAATARACGGCGATSHSPDAAFCRRCGCRLTRAA